MTKPAKIHIERDSTTFGPYTLAEAASYYEKGLLFERDLAYEVGAASSSARPLLTLLKQWQMVPKSGSIWKQLVIIVQKEHALLLPWKSVATCQWSKDKQIIGLMCVGCVPLLLVVLSSQTLTYWGLAAYFSVLWGLFFFSVFKTPQSKPREAVSVFFQTPVLSMIVVSIAQITPPWSWLYAWAFNGGFLLRWLGMFLAVGLIEEFCKAFPVFLLARKPGRMLQPKTVMLYGMISGIGFGIWEGVQYQMGSNRTHGVDTAYFLNMLRLTSLPFIHAIWAGISGYFIGFSMLHGNKRWALRLLAIIVPALLHASYNTFHPIIGFFIAIGSVILLMSYLAAGQQIQTGIKNAAIGNP